MWSRKREVCLVVATMAVFVIGLSACSDDEKNANGENEIGSNIPDVTIGTGDSGANPEDSETRRNLPGDFGFPCESNGDCNSGFCVQSPEGFICTIPCLESCPPGFSCKAIANLRPDIVFICFPDQADECLSLPDGSECDDGNACTTDDTCTQGFCDGGSLVDCEDGNPCTGHSCNFKSGCEYIPIEAACDDENPCTMEDHCEAGICVGGDEMDCFTDDPCLEAFCDLEEGCLSKEKDCDDGNPHTLDICLDDGCENIDGCEDLVVSNQLCALFGSAGEEVSCPFRLARAHANMVDAHGLQFAFDFPQSAVLISHFTSCPDCVDILPPLTSLPTGHYVGMAPPQLTDWTNGGELILVNLGVSMPLTTAYVVDGEVHGEPTFMTAHFILQTDIPEEQPVKILINKVFASDPLAAPLQVQIVDQTLITSVYEMSCTIVGKACDDGNVCTIEDRCITEVCVGEDYPCDDGDACTFDYCDQLTGCFHSGAADGCLCDDGNACTVDTACQAGECIGTVIDACDPPE